MVMGNEAGRIKELEDEILALKQMNEELVKAVNSTKARQMLNFLFRKASKVKVSK
jgi:hypothetical protein